MNNSRLAATANPGGALYPKLTAPRTILGHALRDPFAKKRTRLAWIAVIPAFFAPIIHAAVASDVTLAWNANPEADITGYQLKYGTTSGVYPNVVNVGTTPTTSVAGLTEGTTYYFAVSAINESGLQGQASAEISYLVPTTGGTPPNGWTLRYVDSQEASGFPATFAFDGNPATFWHTAWSSGVTPPPHEIQINLGSVLDLKGFTCLPRQDSYPVGNIGQYEFYVSTDGVSWGNPVATGTFANTSTLKEVLFTSKSGQYIRLRSLSSANGGTECTLAEINVIQGSGFVVNQPPVALPGSFTTPEDTPLAVTLGGTDADGNTLSFSIATGPAHGTLAGTTPNLTYTPAADYNGSDSFTFRANDGTADSAAATVSISVTPVNDAPVAIAKSVTTSEDTPLAITLTGTDKEANSLSFSIISGPANGILSGTPPNLTYSPAANFSGTDQFTFRANDGNLYSSVATVSITVNAVNDMPIAVSKSVTTAQDTALSVTLGGSDPEGNPLTFSILANPTHGTLTGTAPNLTYLPASGFSGSDQFTYRVHDGSTYSATATVSVTVAKKDPFPGTSILARSGWSLKYVDSQETFDSPATFAFDGNPATYWHTQWRSGNNPPPPHEIQINLGAVRSIAGFQYLPRQDQYLVGGVANYEFYVSLDGVNWGSPVATGTFAATKSEKQVLFNTKTGRYIRFRALTEINGFTDICVAELNVLQGTVINQSPLAVSRAVETEEDNPLAISLSGSDPDGNPITYSIVSGPAHGTLGGTAPNLTYLPSADFTGSDQFTFRTNDGAEYSATATVLITVTPVTPVPGNIAPAFGGNPITASATEDASFTGQLTATDANVFDVLIYSKISGPSWLTVSPSGTLGGTPLNANVGANSFTVKVSDPSNASATATLVVTVSNSNDAPAFKINSIVYPAGTEKIPYRDQTLASIATDPDAGDTFTFSKISGPDWLTVAKSGALGGTPPSGSAGNNEFTIRVIDAAGAFADSVLQIKINSNTLPLPWNLDRLGKGNIAGAARYNAGVFTVAGAGALSEKEDAGNFGWQTLGGDGEITARITKLDDTGEATSVGLMIRESLATNSRHVFIGLDGDGQLQWLRRTITGGKTLKTSRKALRSKSPWLRLVRHDDTLVAFQSENGTDWTRIGKINLDLPKNCYIGLSVSSGDKEQLNTSKFSNVRVTR